MEIKTSGGTKLHLAKTAINEGETVISTMAGAFSQTENRYRGAASQMSDEEDGVTEEDVEAAIRNSLSPQEIASFNRLPSWAARSIRRKVRRELERKYQIYQLKKEDDSFDASQKADIQTGNSRIVQSSGQTGRYDQCAWDYRGHSGATRVSASDRSEIKAAVNNADADITTNRSGASMQKSASYRGNSTKSDSVQHSAAPCSGTSTHLGAKTTGTKSAQTAAEATGKTTHTAAKAAGKTTQEAAKTAGKVAETTAKTAGTAAKVGASAGTGAATGGISLAVQGVYEAAKAYVTISVATANWLRSSVAAQSEGAEKEPLSTGFDKNSQKGGILSKTNQQQEQKDNESDGISGVAIFAAALILLIFCFIFLFVGSSYSTELDSELPTEWVLSLLMHRIA